MNPFHSFADVGDLVAARKDIPVTLTEHLTDTPSVRQGTRGLVRNRAGKRLTVAFDTGNGITETTVPARDCRLLQHTANEKRFMNWAQLKAAVRAGALIATAAPIIWFACVYWAETGSLDGVIEALTLTAIDSALELPGLLLAHPTQTILWLLLGGLATRIALGPKPARK
jgi:hypothetical protein